jgi:autotransporter strand-loop-strand O-heptosyltransferase
VANAPSVTITGTDIQGYRVVFLEKVHDQLIELKEVLCMTNQTVSAGIKQWYTDWVVRIYDKNDDLVHEDIFDPTGKVVFIKMDAYALGDSIAWIPYVEEFRLKHDCKVICSTFHNHLFVDAYPEIMFVIPNTYIANVYAQYYIGASNDGNLKYSPIISNRNPLQSVANLTLGLKWGEIQPNLRKAYKYRVRPLVDKYVTLSEFGSHIEKHWQEVDGWQRVVNFLNDRGYKVVVISKEKTNLKNIIDMTDVDLDITISYLMHAEMHLGVSSGLSWLAWGLNTKVMMISDVTPSFHEFYSQNIRINANDLSEIDYGNTNYSKVEKVIQKLTDWVNQ